MANYVNIENPRTYYECMKNYFETLFEIIDEDEYDEENDFHLKFSDEEYEIAKKLKFDFEAEVERLYNLYLINNNNVCFDYYLLNTKNKLQKIVNDFIKIEIK